MAVILNNTSCGRETSLSRSTEDWQHVGALFGGSHFPGLTGVKLGDKSER